MSMQHLARKAHAIHVMDRSLRYISVNNEPVYRNKIETTYYTCNSAFCTVPLLRKAGVSEGVDTYLTPVYVGNARFVSVAPLKTSDAPHTCSHCGNTIPKENY